MITIYVDPADGNQVMAYYRNCTGEPSDQGWVEVKVSEEDAGYRDLVRFQRECRFNDGVVTPRANPDQETPNPVDIARKAARVSGRDKLVTLGFTDEEIAAMGLG